MKKSKSLAGLPTPLSSWQERREEQEQDIYPALATVLAFYLGLPEFKVVAGGTGPATVLSVGHLEQGQGQGQG